MISKANEVKVAQMVAAQIKGDKSIVWVRGYGLKGLAVKPIQQATGMNYSQTYLAICAAAMPKAELLNVNQADGTPKPEGVINAMVTEARLSGQSWGYIMARTGLSEGRVRKAFAATTGIQSVGLRNGHGGRFLNKDATLYTGGDRKAFGSEVKVGQPVSSAKPTVKRKVALKVAAVAIKKAANQKA